VTFVREFVQKDRVRSVRFSPDGKYLAAVVSGNKNGVIFIYNVETGNKIW
jgi:WD40 repeat protein